MPVPAVTVADPGYGDSRDKRPARSMQECRRLLLLLAPCTQAGRVGRWASGCRQAGSGAGSVTAETAPCLPAARSGLGHRGQAERGMGTLQPARRGLQERCPGCPAWGQCRGRDPAVLQRGQPQDALAGASGWRVPEQLSQHAKALASLPMTCRSVAGLFTLGSHVVPTGPPARAPLPPSQARRPCRLGEGGCSAAPLPAPRLPPHHKSATHTIKELVSTG